jgi:hypothetical protein
MLPILAAVAALTSGHMDWCHDINAPDKPRNIEDRTACASEGVPVFVDRMIAYEDSPPSCEKTAKHLSKDGAVDPPAQIGDGYWVVSFTKGDAAIRCHIVKIVGKTITMQLAGPPAMAAVAAPTPSSTQTATGAPGWCTDDNAVKPRNIENTAVCAAAGVPLYMDRMSEFRDGPQTCANAAKHLSEDGTLGGPPEVGDGYWIESFDLEKPAIRCHIVSIDGKRIRMK